VAVSVDRLLTNVNILIYVPEMAAFGGMERHICLLALRCAASANRVALVTTSNSLNQASRQQLREAGIQLRELAAPRHNSSRARKLLWLLWTALRMRSGSWDVIYSNGQSGLARFIWLAANKQTSIIHHHHTSGDAAEQTTWHPAFRKVLARAPRLVACSSTTRANLQSGLGRHDITFLPYLTPDLVSSSEVAERTYASGAPLRIGFIGRLVSTKGIDTLCDLSCDPAFDGVRWQIHGKGEKYSPPFFDRFPNIEYHGPYASIQDCARILLGLDAVALFSRHNEGMPLTLIEAMAAGLPWIATDQGGTRELAIAPENCEVIPASAGLDEVKHHTLRFIARIRSGDTSRVSQRFAYDQNFAPALSAGRWLEYLGLPSAR